MAPNGGYNLLLIQVLVTNSTSVVLSISLAKFCVS